MSKMLKRLVALVLSFCLMLAPSISAFASEGENTETEIVNPSEMENGEKTDSTIDSDAQNEEEDSKKEIELDSIILVAEENNPEKGSDNSSPENDTNSAEDKEILDGEEEPDENALPEIEKLLEIESGETLDDDSKPEEVQGDALPLSFETSDGTQDAGEYELNLSDKNKDDNEDNLVIESEDNHNDENIKNTENVESKDLVSALENPSFNEGFAETIKETQVYKNTDKQIVIARLLSGVVEVIGRANAGEEDDQLRVCFTNDDQIIEGYVASSDLHPCTEEEIKAWNESEKKVQVLLENNEDISVIEVITEELDSDDNETINEASVIEEAEILDITEEKVSTLLAADALSIVEKDETNSVVEISEVKNEQLDIIGEDENLLTAVDGDVILVTGSAKAVRIAATAGAQSYASYTMETAGLLTLIFKSVGTAHGNVTLSIKDENDNTLWYKVWATSEGTINYSDFVEAGEYTIILGKSDSTDTSVYDLSLTPMVSKTGELGTKNNTATSSAELTLGTKATGIITTQDCIASNKDYYKFTLSSPAWVTLNYTNKTIADLEFYLFGDDAITENITSMNLTGWAAGNPNETSTVTVNHRGLLDAGVYYIRVKHGGATGRYEITVSSESVTITEKEKNDTFIKAYNAGNKLAITGTELIGVLSESDGNDCYCIHLDKPTRIDLSLKIEFSDVYAAVYTRDGDLVTDSEFGKNGTSGAEGNPYELEKRGLRLEAGDYFVYVGYGSGYSTGRYRISARAKITAAELKVIVDGSVAKITAASSPSNIIPVKSYINIFEKATSYKMEGYEFSNQTSISKQITIPASGDYVVQYVVTDGNNNWDEKWATFTYNGVDFEIQDISATSDENGKITCKATYSGNGALKNSTAKLLLNSVLIEEKELGGATSWTFNAPTSGVYDIEFWGTITGGTWKSGTRKHTVNKKAALPLQVSELTVSSEKNGNISCVAATKDGKTLQNVTFNLFQGSSLVKSNTGKSLTSSFKVNTSGLYKVQCVAYDGERWAEKWAVVTVTISNSAVLTVSSIHAEVDEAGKISMTATTSGGNALVSSVFNIFEGSNKIAEVKATNGKATYQASKNATYKIQYVAYDGKTWAEKWTVVTVSIPGLAPEITSLTVASDASGAITIDSTYTSKKPVLSMTYNVFDSSSKLVSYESTKDATHSVQYVTKAGTYKIQAVLYDGSVWVEKWATVSVTVSSSSETDLSITALTIQRTSANSFIAKGTTNDNRALLSSKMNVFRNGQLVAEKNCTNKQAEFSGLAVGTYIVQYVAYDGKKWAEKWGSVVLGTSTLTIDSWNVTGSGPQYDCSATVTNEIPIKEAKMVVFDTNNKEVARWDWSGTGDYLNHTFNIESGVTIKVIQYVVYDGVQWVEAWTTV